MPKKVTKVGFTFEQLRLFKSFGPLGHRSLSLRSVEEEPLDSSLELQSEILSISHGSASLARLGISVTDVQSKGSRIRANIRKLDAFKASI